MSKPRNITPYQIQKLNGNTKVLQLVHENLAKLEKFKPNVKIVEITKSK